MNHPPSEAWVPYIFDEAEPGTRAKLSEHLRHCPECRTQIEGWQCSLRRLNAWQLPAVPRRRTSAKPVLKWAAAAAVVLALGFAFGRITSPIPNVENLRAAVEPGLRQQIRQEVTQMLRAELEQVESQRVADYVALKQDLDTVAVLTDVSLRDTQQRLVQLAEFTTPASTVETKR